MRPRECRFLAAPGAGDVSALLLRPPRARCLLVYGHGAGADMHHRFNETAARTLAERGVATFRYNFPYAEAGRRRPDRTAVLVTTVRSAVGAAALEAPDLPLLAGGKSMGGRMTSTAAADEPLDGVRGIVFFGFPLHRPGEQSTDRASHLERVSLPMLFLQGTRDRLADLELVRAVCVELGPQAELHVVDGGDHSFKVPRSTGRTEAEVLRELGDAVSRWAVRQGL